MGLAHGESRPSVAGANDRAVRRLLLSGGGDYSEDTLKRFADWTGIGTGKALVVTWNHGRENESFVYFSQRLAPHGITNIVHAPEVPEMYESQSRFLTLLSEATSVFFTGGDQNRTMDLLDQFPEIAIAIRQAYERGIAFGGTSAGTAIMSKTMLTGNGNFATIKAKAVEVREGLGFLTDIVVDQHFVKRLRLNRLLSVLMDERNLKGLGVDENAAVALENERQAEVLGLGQAVLIQKVPKAAEFNLAVFEPGNTFTIP